MLRAPLRPVPHAYFFHWQTIALFFGFIGLRVLSLLLAPHAVIQGILVFALLMLLAGLYFKNPAYAWYMVLIELAIGGAGHYLELGPLSLRLLLVYSFASLWCIQALSRPALRMRLHIPHTLYYVLLPVILTAVYALFRGLFLGNPPTAVLTDAIPFTYFILLFPAYHLLHEDHLPTIIFRLIIVFFVGNALYALLVLGLFSAEIVQLHDPIYNWLRDVAAAKITQTGTGFFRFILPEHMLVLPFMLLSASALMGAHQRHRTLLWILTLLGSLILAITMSRAYLLGLSIGLLVLLYRHTWWRWFSTAGITLAACFLFFFSLHFLASGGTSFGLSLLSHRFGAIAAPATELSSYTRWLLLDPIFEKITASPLLGVGLGSTLAVIDPVTGLLHHTNQYDWGYLELIAELGIFGLLFYLIFLLFLLLQLRSHTKIAARHHDVYIGALGGLIALLITAVFGPTLSHVFGVISLVFLVALAAHPPTLLGRMVERSSVRFL